MWLVLMLAVIIKVFNYDQDEVQDNKMSHSIVSVSDFNRVDLWYISTRSAT